MATSQRSGLLPLVLILAIVGAIAGVYFYQQQDKGDGDITLGAVLPLTGQYAQYGIVPQSAIQLAIEQRMAAGYPYKIVVQYEDSQLRPDRALTAFRKLVDVQKVPVIFGAAGSNETEVIGPLAQKENVVLISPSSTAASLSRIGDYFFRTIPTDIYEGAFMARFVLQRGVKKIGLLAVNDTGTKSLVDAFRDEFVRSGGEIASYALAPKDTSDLRTQITALRASAPQAVFFVGYATETGVFLRQQNELGLGLPLYSAHPAEAPEVRQIAGKAADNLIFSTPADASDSPAGKSFKAAYQARYSKEPGEFAPEAYDAANLVLDAIEKVGAQASRIRDYLHQVHDYQGASGTITFSATGDVEKPINVKVIRNGNIEPFEDVR